MTSCVQDYQHIVSAPSSPNHKSLSGPIKEVQGEGRMCSSLLLQAELRNRFLQDHLEMLEKQNAGLRLEQAALNVCLLWVNCLLSRISSLGVHGQVHSSLMAGMLRKVPAKQQVSRPFIARHG